MANVKGNIKEGVMSRTIDIKELALYVAQTFNSAVEKLKLKLSLDKSDEYSMRTIHEMLLAGTYTEEKIEVTIEELGQVVSMMDEDGRRILMPDGKSLYLWGRTGETSGGLGGLLMAAYHRIMEEAGYNTGNLLPMYDWTGEELQRALESVQSITAPIAHIEKGIVRFRKSASRPHIFSVFAETAA